MFKKITHLLIHLYFLGNLYAAILITYIIRIYFSVTGNAVKQKKSILYLETFPVENAGYQYRAQKWAEILNKNGYQSVVWTTNKHHKIFDFTKGSLIQIFVRELWLRLWQILKSKNFEFVVVRRELLMYNDYGNLFLEKLLLQIHPTAILDIDDNLLAQKKKNNSKKNIFSILALEAPNKTSSYYHLFQNIIVASSFLKNQILNESSISKKNIYIIPTCVDYNKYEVKKYNSLNKPKTIGWIGGNHNYILIDNLIPILNKIYETIPFEFILIGGDTYTTKTDFKIKFIPWDINSEIDNLYKIDIGIMPLDDSELSKGKGGFKLIQYMGLGIVSVASNITINKEIIDNNIDSFLVSNDKEWFDTLIKLLSGDCDLNKIGLLARAKIDSKYTFEANTNNYLKIFRDN